MQGRVPDAVVSSSPLIQVRGETFRIQAIFVKVLGFLVYPQCPLFD